MFCFSVSSAFGSCYSCIVRSFASPAVFDKHKQLFYLSVYLFIFYYLFLFCYFDFLQIRTHGQNRMHFFTTFIYLFI